MHILLADSIAHMIIPHGEHCSCKVLIAGCGIAVAGIHIFRHPLLIKHPVFQKIMIIMCGRYYIKVCVTKVHDLAIAFIQGCAHISPAIIPCIHMTLSDIDRCLALHHFEASPDYRRLSKAGNVFYIMIGEMPELLGFLQIVFVSAYMDIRPCKDRIVPGYVFRKESVKKFIHLRLIEVKVIHSVFFIVCGKTGIVMCEGKRMCRDINLRDYLYPVTAGHLLELPELLLRI